MSLYGTWGFKSPLRHQIDVHRTTIHRWEKGTRRPSGVGAVRYLKALDKLSRR